MEVRGSHQNVSRFAGIAVVTGAVVALGVAALLPGGSSTPAVKLVTPAAQIADVTTTTALPHWDPPAAPEAPAAIHGAVAAPSAPVEPATASDASTTVAPTQEPAQEVTTPTTVAGDLPDVIRTPDDVIRIHCNKNQDPNWANDPPPGGCTEWRD